MSNKIGFYDKVKFLETLDIAGQLSPEAIAALIASLKNNKSLMIHFANNVKNAQLVRQIAQQGFFDNPPEPVITEKVMRHEGWIEGVLLVRLANQIPEIVLDVIRNIKTKNMYAYATLLEAALKIEMGKVHEVWPCMISWLDKCEWFFYPIDYTKLAKKLSEKNYIDEVLSFLEIVLKPVSPKKEDTKDSVLKDHTAKPKYMFLKQEFREDRSISSVVDCLEDKRPLIAIKLLEEYLNEAILIEKNSSGSDFVDTGYWRSAIEDHEQNIIPEFKGYLLDLLRDSLEKAVINNHPGVREIIEQYLQNDSLIYKRLALHLIRIGKEKCIDLIRRELLKAGAYDDLYIHHEFFLLLRDGFPLLEKQSQQNILSIIKAGPSIQEINEHKKYISENYPDANPEKCAENYARSWIRARMYMIKNYLEGGDKDLWAELSKGIDFEDYHPDFTSYMGKGGFVAHVSPLTQDEWQQMTIAQKVEYIVKWRHKEERGFSLREVCPEGFAKLLKEDIKKQWDGYKPELHHLITEAIYPCYAYKIIELITETLGALNSDGEQKDLAFDSVDYEYLLDIFLCTIAKWVNDGTSDSHETGYSRSVCTRTLGALGELSQYLEKTQQWLDDEKSRRMRDIIIRLCSNTDPSPDEDDPKEERYVGYWDPITTSINHIRPIALRELLRYAVARANVLKPESKKWEKEVEDIVTNMLKDTAYSVRSVFGECWGWLYYLDNSWVETHHKDIFPENFTNRYFVAAWDGYILCKPYVNDPRYDLMRPLYIHAIDNALQENTSRTHLEPARKLAEHLAGFYKFGIEKLPTSSSDLRNPLVYLYSKGPNRISSHMIWALWTWCKNTEDINEKNEIWGKVIQLWYWRLKSVLPEKRNDFFAEEMTWFVHFLTIKELCVVPPQVEKLILDSIQYIGRNDNTHELNELIDYLAMVADKHVDFSVKVLKSVLEIHGANWYFGDEDKKVKIILKSATNSTWEIKKDACKIVHKLGEYGHHWARDYLDELRK